MALALRVVLLKAKLVDSGYFDFVWIIHSGRLHTHSVTVYSPMTMSNPIPNSHPGNIQGVRNSAIVILTRNQQEGLNYDNSANCSDILYTYSLCYSQQIHAI